MKTVARALFLALMLFVAGCSWYRSYSYGTPEAETCLEKCDNAMWACRARCGANQVCMEDCEATDKACRKGCPAVSPVEPNDPY